MRVAAIICAHQNSVGLILHVCGRDKPAKLMNSSDYICFNIIKSNFTRHVLTIYNIFAFYRGASQFNYIEILCNALLQCFCYLTTCFHVIPYGSP
jgi:hypothetical protein